MAAALPFTSSGAVLEIAESIAIRVAQELPKTGAQSPQLSDGTARLLIDLIQYLHTQRAKPSKWSSTLDESEFQERVEEMLNVRRADLIGREVRFAGGRVDFAEFGACLELKVVDLGGDPQGGIAAHRQQTAEYAAAINVPVGLLLVLDEHRYAGGTKHLPDISNFIAVDSVESLPGVLGTSTSRIVVTMVIPAYPPLPSRMGQGAAIKAGRPRRKGKPSSA